MQRVKSAIAGVLAVLLMALATGGGVRAAAGTTHSTLQSAVSVATTQASARRQGAVTVGGINWDCRGASCKAATAPAAVAAPVEVCKALAREVGAMVSFEAASRKLSSGELQQCNSAITATAASSAAVPLTKSVFGALPAPPPASSAPAARTYPVSLRTADLTVTGVGRLAERAPFTPKSARTAELTVTGIGRLTDRLPFTPKSIRTAELTVTGTGVVR
jgi:hypothetical protein